MHSDTEASESYSLEPLGMRNLRKKFLQLSQEDQEAIEQANALLGI